MMQIVPDPSNLISPPLATLEVSIINEPFELSSEYDGPTIVRDIEYLESTTATVRNDIHIQAVLANGNNRGIEFESLNESIATVDDEGHVTVVSEGRVGILIKHDPLRKRVNHDATIQTGQTFLSFSDYVDGSLGKILNTEIDSTIGDGGELQLFSTKNHATSTYVRNANCWIDADVTCWPVWNSWSGSSRYSGCLVSPRHMLGGYLNWSVGMVFRFVTNSNQVIEREVTAIETVTDRIKVANLDSDVPAESIKFAKVLPADWLDYLTFASNPILAGNQFTELVLRLGTAFYPNESWKPFTHYPATGELRTPYTKNIVLGDSVSPLFKRIDSELVLIGTHYSAIGASLISAFITEINPAMTTLGGGYQLTEIDLSSYPNYGD